MIPEGVKPHGGVVMRDCCTVRTQVEWDEDQAVMGWRLRNEESGWGGLDFSPPTVAALTKELSYSVGAWPFLLFLRRVYFRFGFAAALRRVPGFGPRFFLGVEETTNWE